MLIKGDLVVVNDKCKCPTWIGQKRKVSMVITDSDIVFATKRNGTDEHLFHIRELDKE